MPIAILEIPKGRIIDIPEAEELCNRVGDCLHDELGVPDEEDKESRVIRASLDETILRIAFTIGEHEYRGFEQESFFPTTDQIESAGKSVLEIIKELQLDVSRVVIEAWRDTTFALRKEEEIPEPLSPASKEALREIGSHLSNPRIKLVLSPQKREGVSSLKELDRSQENGGHQEVALKLSKCMTEILGLKETITAEVKYADLADTDVCVELDCEPELNNFIPKEVREYMAESVLHILNTSQSTKEGSAEVWIRQGKPEVEFDKQVLLS